MYRKTNILHFREIRLLIYCITQVVSSWYEYIYITNMEKLKILVLKRNKINETLILYFYIPFKFQWTFYTILSFKKFIETRIITNSLPDRVCFLNFVLYIFQTRGQGLWKSTWNCWLITVYVLSTGVLAVMTSAVEIGPNYGPNNWFIIFIARICGFFIRLWLDC